MMDKARHGWSKEREQRETVFVISSERKLIAREDNDWEAALQLDREGALSIGRFGAESGGLEANAGKADEKERLADKHGKQRESV